MRRGMLDAVVVGDNERLLSLSRDRHQRTHNGEYVMWCVMDRFQRLPMLCSGKLSAVQAYINEHAQTAHDRVHLSGLAAQTIPAAELQPLVRRLVPAELVAAKETWHSLLFLLPVPPSPPCGA